MEMQSYSSTKNKPKENRSNQADWLESIPYFLSLIAKVSEEDRKVEKFCLIIITICLGSSYEYDTKGKQSNLVQRKIRYPFLAFLSFFSASKIYNRKSVNIAGKAIFRRTERDRSICSEREVSEARKKGKKKKK